MLLPQYATRGLTHQAVSFRHQIGERRAGLGSPAQVFRQLEHFLIAVLRIGFREGQNPICKATPARDPRRHGPPGRFRQMPQVRQRRHFGYLPIENRESVFIVVNRSNSG